MKKIVKIPGIIIIVLIVLVVIIRLALPMVAVEIANRQLPGILNTEASIGSLQLGLLRGYISIRDLRIAQPEGFGEGHLLLAPEMRVKVKLSSLFHSPLTVEEIALTDWEVNIIKNADGVMNIDAIQPESSPELYPTAEPESGKKSEEDPAPAAKPILVQKFFIKNLTCSYIDHAIALEEEETVMAGGDAEEEPEVSGELVAFSTDSSPEAAPESVPQEGLSPDSLLPESSTASSSVATGDVPMPELSGPSPLPFPVGLKMPERLESAAQDEEKGEDEKEVLRVLIASLDLLVTDLLIDPAADPASVKPAEVLLTARIIQDPFTDGFLGLKARMGPVGAGLPAVNAVLRLAHLSLDKIDVVVPDGIAQVLGGSALDLTVDLLLADYILDCEIEVEASGGHSIPLSIGGTPDQPEIDTSSLLFGVMLHFGGGVGSLVGNIGGAGYQVGAAAAESTLAVGVGTANVLGSIGGGLFKTVTSAATGDLDGAVEGLSDTTVGTANEAAATAGDVAGVAAEGATATADSTTGEDADREWRADTPSRWQESWNEARELLIDMEFPPPPRENAEAVVRPAAVPEPSPVIEGDDETLPTPLPEEFGGEEPF